MHQGHIWSGRILIILSIVNGGTGLLLGDNSPGGEKVYETLATIVAVLYIVLVALWYFNRAKSSENESAGTESEPETRAGRHISEISGTQKIG